MACAAAAFKFTLNDGRALRASAGECMAPTFTRWMRAVLLTTLGSAAATPALPASSIAAQAVREALAPAAPARTTPTVRAPQPAPRVARSVQAPVARPAATPAPRPAQAARPAQTPAARAAQVAPNRAAQTRAQNIQRVQAEVARSTTRTGRTAVVRATAYNSLANQTDSTPFITATGTRTRPGVVALSRDLLGLFPYGTRITIEDLSGRSGNLFRGRVFIVEDTMAARMRGRVDIWMASYGDAVRFGSRQVRITAVR